MREGGWSSCRILHQKAIESATTSGLHCARFIHLAGKMLVRVFFLICFFGAAANAAVTSEQFAECAATKAAMDRLACYDKLANDEVVGIDASSVPETTTASSWAVQESKDPINDTDTVVVSTVAQAGTNQFGRPVTLLIRCQSLELEIFIAWNDYLASDGGFDTNQKNVTIRFGNESATNATWLTSTDQAATFAPNPMGLLRLMVKSPKFTAQVVPYHQGPTTAVFDTSGLEGVLPPLVEACRLKF